MKKENQRSEKNKNQETIKSLCSWVNMLFICCIVITIVYKPYFDGKSEFINYMVLILCIISILNYIINIIYLIVTKDKDKSEIMTNIAYIFSIILLYVIYSL